MTTYELTADRSGERLDVFVSRRCPDVSRSRAHRLIEEGLVTVDGRPAKASQQVATGAAISVTVPPPEEVSLLPESIPVTVVYEDLDLMVVDKPAGLTVHPGPGHPRGTLVNALLARSPKLREMADGFRPGIVHRLDKDTSGLMVVAKNERALEALQQQLKDRRVKKTYLALVHGLPSPAEGVIEAPIGRHPKNRQKMGVVAGGREATTRYRFREQIGDRYSLLEVEPVTGRTHQIRVHLAAIGHPVVGDRTYGRRSDLVDRQFLHASKLAFETPLGGRQLEFESPLPPDLRAALDRARHEANR